MSGSSRTCAIVGVGGERHLFDDFFVPNQYLVCRRHASNPASAKRSMTFAWILIIQDNLHLGIPSIFSMAAFLHFWYCPCPLLGRTCVKEKGNRAHMITESAAQAAGPQGLSCEGLENLLVRAAASWAGAAPNDALLVVEQLKLEGYQVGFVFDRGTWGFGNRLASSCLDKAFPAANSQESLRQNRLHYACSQMPYCSLGYFVLIALLVCLKS